MRPSLSVRLCRLSILTRLLTITLLLFIFSCSKKTETAAANDRFPLITNTDDLTAASHKAGSKMLVLDLSADWCMPCRLLEPVLHELAEEFKEKTVFYRVDVDKSRDLAASFGVQGIPYVLFLKDNKVIYSLTGLNPKENYMKVLSSCPNASSADRCADLIKEKMQN
jgi:thioredoxin 1